MSSIYDWARYLATILKPPTAQTPNYAFSVATFCDEIGRDTQDGAEVMISCDVASLYTKVPRQQAHKVTQQRLDGHIHIQQTYIGNRELWIRPHLELSPTSTVLIPYVPTKRIPLTEKSLEYTARRKTWPKYYHQLRRTL